MLRIRRGLTIARFAELVGVRHTTVDSWESGEHAPQLEKFPVIARVLGVTPRGLLPVSEGAIVKRKQKAANTPAANTPAEPPKNRRKKPVSKKAGTE